MQEVYGKQMFKQILKKIELTTGRQFEVIDITAKVKEVITKSGITAGQIVIYSTHTTASIKINQFEPMLLQDIMAAVYRLVPQDISYNHDVFELRQNITPGERSNGHAHVKAFLLGSSANAIITEGKLLLGERQSVLFVELDGGRKRDFYVQITGE